MFDFFTNLWQAVRAFLMGVAESASEFISADPFFAATVAVYVVGIVIALIVFLPKTNA